MRQASKKQGINLRPGNVISGKWHHRKYVIKKQLGSGAIGSVYLCEHNGKYAALKISDKSSSITMEVNVLKTFQKVQGNRLGPSLLDVDDWVDFQGNRWSFYVMEYLKGSSLADFLQRHGDEWLGILMLQILDDLESLHQTGWVFGDLKSDNLIVTHPPARLRWIDVGGTTQIGRSIKEYTEFFDRGYWQMGSRKAEPSYDLFALAMVMIQYYYPNRFERGNSPERTLMNKVKQIPQLQKYQPTLRKALTGQYSSSEQMKNELATILMGPTTKQTQYRRPTKTTTAKPKTQYQARNDDGQGHPILESVGICIVVLFFYFCYLFLL
ncbi:serine/threonine protein kinase [Aquibacillus sediminis]|uniref:serine/threonine protein kinase n=1 Tax=Aquibacillus sediminis TaxID=2574734 RepID=UPI0011084B03|nr:protein kinase [Aquibacillus sediminis]